MIYPVLWWVGASLKQDSELTLPGLFPQHPVLDNFVKGWSAIPKFSFTHFFANTFELVIILIVLSLISCSITAFALARLDFPLRKVWLGILLVTMMLPAQVTLIPQYSMFHSLNLINTYMPFIIPHLLAGGIGGSFFVYLLVQFMRGIPRELDESAKMDGCSWFGIYWRIMLPLIRPALVTTALYCFLWNWDDFFGHLIYINSVSKYTVGLAIKLFVDTQSGDGSWGQLLAMSLVSIVPSTIFFFAVQKQFVEGIAAGALKG
ncbi:carbohydrate ABC transporter permease [Paenibacillus sp. SYP-B3998]|uniref:Carbohydrate ABC transporter permease n=1 Tax=Paenibacillus sp. SYP-B3998 TaxID=2678564 RepID=A0A6G3ZUB5_9BACL|nr:carbohydrate ABC transporter permease [Paenibacillus sp. SYP-B3998]NEW05007.1 carbohydrate ABC transporter permease [Paenibacillus sp. SYP-B3998]